MGVSLQIDAPFWRNSAGVVTGSLADLRQQLFAGGADGFWLDFWDMTSLAQVDDGTSPVTAAGQTVEYIADKSGNNRNAVQPTGAIAPEFNGIGSARRLDFVTNDYLNVPIPLSGITSFTFIAALNLTNNGAARKTIIEGYGSAGAYEALNLEIDITGNNLTGGYKSGYASGIPAERVDDAAAFPFGTDNVVCIRYNSGTNSLELRRNGLVKDTKAPTGTVGTNTGFRLMANRTPDRYAAGRLYNAIFVFDHIDPTAIENALMARLGILRF